MNTFRSWEEMGFSPNTPVTKATQNYWNQMSPVDFMQSITVELRQELAVAMAYTEILQNKINKDQSRVSADVLEKFNSEDIVQIILTQEKKMRDILEVIWGYSNYLSSSGRD